MKIYRSSGELLIGKRYFYCNISSKSVVKDWIARWKSRIMEMQDGESAYIILGLGGMSDETMSVPMVKGLKALKQKGNVTVYSASALEPCDEYIDKLLIYSELEASGLAFHGWTGNKIAEYNLQEFMDLPIYTGDC